MTQTMQESTGLMSVINLLLAPILMVPIFVLGIIATLRNLNFWQLTTLDGTFIIQVSFCDYIQIFPFHSTWNFVLTLLRFIFFEVEIFSNCAAFSQYLNFRQIDLSI